MNIPDLPPEGMQLPGAERYVLRKLLGRGGFGDAYLADDSALARRVVIKLLINLSEPTIRERFTREARIAANIHHPAVVQVHDIGALPDGRPYFVMEFVDGMSLTDFIKQRGASLLLSHALTLLAEAAEGLAVAHKMEVVHRDIKPDNILVTRDGHAKLIDFGIAKKAVQESDASSAKHTNMGTVLGTPRYISPEQATAKVLAGASDLYSLGCVMYVLLTGRSPFDGSPQELMMHHVYTPPPTLASATPGRSFPPEIEGIVGRLLTKDPLRRHQSGDELAKELRRCAALAKLSEATDATAALPSVRGDVTLDEPRNGAATLSNSHAADVTPPPKLWDGATEDLSQMGLSPLPSREPPRPGAGHRAEGEPTEALDVAAPAHARREDSISAPLQVMEDITGRTEPAPRGNRIAVVLGVLLLLASALGGTLFLVSRSRGTSESPASVGPQPSSKTKDTIENEAEKKGESVESPNQAEVAEVTSAKPEAATSADAVDAAKSAAPKPAVSTAPLAGKPTTVPTKTSGTSSAKAPVVAGTQPTAGTATGAPKPSPAPVPTAPPPTNTGTAIDDRL